MVPVYYRNGSLIFWLIAKRCVVEIRLPVFVWKTSHKRKEVYEEGSDREKEKLVRVWRTANSSTLYELSQLHKA